ncbi:MAG: hypothetical protein ABI282_09965 [Candidatus Baltobacteraceae bacterium]
MIVRLLAIVLCGCSLLGPQPTQAGTLQRWIVTSDIHFDPFTDTRIAVRLNAAPSERWRAIFQAAGPMPFSNYGTDDVDDSNADVSDWRAYWCGNVALTKTGYAACAMPHVAGSPPPEPTVPPARTPAPEPSP